MAIIELIGKQVRLKEPYTPRGCAGKSTCFGIIADYYSHNRTFDVFLEAWHVTISLSREDFVVLRKQE